MKLLMVLAVFFTVTINMALAGISTFISQDVAHNSETFSAWLSACSISSPEYIVDFENIPDGTNLQNNNSLFQNLVIYQSSGVPYVRSSSSYFGGSNPIDSKAAALLEDSIMSLDFSANPVDYIGFYDIDVKGCAVTVYLTDNSVINLPSDDATGTSDNTAEFYGIFRNDMPRITKVTLNAVYGDSEWGIDNISYGAIPEPATCVMLAAGVLYLIRRK
jgi:hypothetical protein